MYSSMNPDKESSSSPAVEELTKEVQSLREQLKKAHAENERLRKALEEALRSLKRQAAPFSKGKPKSDPKQPGRKSGGGYGQRAFRAVPERVDEQIAVPLPRACPDCGGQVIHDNTQPQFQEDIVRQTIVRRFDVETGHCADCGEHVQGRHPLQTSDALGAAQVQVGPQALTLAAHLNKQMGISHERAGQILEWGYGLRVSRSALCRAMTRLGKKAEPTYQELQVAVRQSPVNQLDETGWRVAAHLEWLWVCVNAEITLYAILPGRGFAQAASILGADYSGFLNHDGWQPYYRFPNAFHQTCLSHLIRRCKDMIETASRTAAQFPMAVMELLLDGLVLRDRYQRQEISWHGLNVATGRLEANLERWLVKTFRDPANRRLAKHLRHEAPWLFTFLHCPGIEATNNAAERALRPAVVARKTWGGNRTENGAKTQQILISVLTTCHQQGKDSFDRITKLFFSPTPMVLDLIPNSS
jgi:transposase